MELLNWLIPALIAYNAFHIWFYGGFEWHEPYLVVIVALYRNTSLYGLLFNLTNPLTEEDNKKVFHAILHYPLLFVIYFHATFQYWETTNDAVIIFYLDFLVHSRFWMKKEFGPHLVIISMGFILFAGIPTVSAAVAQLTWLGLRLTEDMIFPEPT